MRAADIRAALEADPNTVFAIRPPRGGTRFVLIRGLLPVRPGLWVFYGSHDGRGWASDYRFIVSQKIIPKAWVKS